VDKKRCLRARAIKYVRWKVRKEKRMPPSILFSLFYSYFYLSSTYHHTLARSSFKHHLSHQLLAQRKKKRKYLKMSALECDFNDNPTTLYLMIQDNDWSSVNERAKLFPEEVRTWIVRTNPDTLNLQWRILPLHAAILSQAPQDVLETLLSVYSLAAKEQDDVGCLPIHWAIKKHCEPETINVLLAAYPKCVQIKNNAGVTPVEQSQQSSSPHKEYYLRALSPGPTYNAVTQSMSDLLCGINVCLSAD
jgi:hypothetical protein